MTEVWRYSRPLTQRTLDSRLSSALPDEQINDESENVDNHEGGETDDDLNTNSEYTYSGTETDDDHEDEPSQRSKLTTKKKKKGRKKMKEK